MPFSPLVAVVDDDVSMREAISLVLRWDGFRTETFDSAEAFLNRDGEHRIACIVLDIHLQGLSGLELGRRLADVPAAPPIILMSAHLDTDGEKKALGAGALAVLHKPFTDETLIDTIRQALRIRLRDRHSKP